MAEPAEGRPVFTVPDNALALEIFGRQDENLRAIERLLGVRIVSRGNQLVVHGPTEATDQALSLLGQLLDLARQGHPISTQEVQYAAGLAKEGRGSELGEVFAEALITTTRGRTIRPKTVGQRRYVDAMREHSLVFCVGPAGTGKTYLAMAMAIAAFKRREVARLVLTRPAVEAGEKLGFLPGDLQEKVDPYLRPLYDAIFDILGVEAFGRYMERGTIEVAPLAYMRGRTLDDAFVILDEAQNTTPEQMKMFLTRLGFGSRAVVTGDVTQVDLPADRESGLQEVRRVLAGVEGLAFVDLDESDVVRHPLVQSIIRAYERFEVAGGRKSPPDGEPK